MRERYEKDLIGEKTVPADAYWGIHTQRARENFSLSGRPVNPALISAYAQVKKAACQANAELGYLPLPVAQAIETACDRIIAGGCAAHFPTDALQGGAGTSTNMNLNEVIANLAIEHLGGQRGDYTLVHPLDHVNLHQSTNDTYPTAVKIAAIHAFRCLSRSVEAVQGSLQAREKEWAAVVTIGRTELREAVPITLGAVFGGFAEAFSRDRWRAYKCEERLRVVPLGGTAVGTGLGAPYAYAVLAIEKLRANTGFGLTRAEQGVDQTMNMDALVESMGMLQAHATTLIKTADDLRVLSMLGEIKLPAVQAGSSLMPGKINPVIPEAVAQAGLKAVANNGLLAAAVSRGNLQISQYMPLIADTLLETLDLLNAADRLLAGCVAGITADPAVCRAHLDASPGLVTALVPEIGYARAEALIAGYDPADGKTVRAYLSDRLGAELVDRVLAPERLLASS